MLKHHFESEMRILYEEAEQFGSAYPEEAGYLNFKSLKDKDPHIERLLEGMAFLSANVKAKLEDDLPEIAETFIRQMCPELLQPFPSCFIAQFSNLSSHLESYLFPKGTEIKSQKLGPEDTECCFKTLADFEFLPVQLNEVSQEVVNQKQPFVQLHFEMLTTSDLKKSAINQIPIYINADLALSYKLMYLFLKKVKSVTLKWQQEKNQHQIVLGGQAIIQPCYLESSFSQNDIHGFHNIIDYFAFREKQFFIKILNLNFNSLPSGVKDFQIEIELEGLESGAQSFMLQKNMLRKEQFQLNCVPVINLYQFTAEPIKVSHFQYEYPIIPCISNPKSIQVNSVSSVQSILKNQNGNQAISEYPSLYSFKTGKDSPQYYALREKYLTPDLFPHYVLSLGGTVKINERLSCTITVNNGNYPRDYLPEYTLQGHSPKIPKSFKITNLTRPSSWVMASRTSGYLWNFLSYLSINMESLSDIVTLKNCLSLLDWSSEKDNLKRRNAVKEIKIHAFDTLYRGAFWRGIEYHLTVEESGFVSMGDILLFGEALHRLLAHRISFNQLLKTKIHCDPSKHILSWEPTVGKQCPL